MAKYIEEKIATYSQKGTRIQLLKVTDKYKTERYQVRINRKVKYSDKFEWNARNYFKNVIYNIITQTKIDFPYDY